MRTPLAWLNLAHYKMRTLAAVAGVAFSVVLIFMQMGFRGSVETTASLLYDALEFDVLLRSPEYLHVAAARTFPRDRLYQAGAVPGVLRVCPLHVGVNHWRNPHTGQRRRILVLGFRPEDPVFRVSEIQRKAASLSSPEFVLIDRQSRREFGPADDRCFGDADIDVTAEAGGRQVRIKGHYSLGGGLAANGGILLNERGFCRICPGRSFDDVSLGLVKLDEGAQPDVVAKLLRDALPNDVELLTRRETIDRETRRWIHETPAGEIFGLGVIVALMVGTAIVYQVLSSDVADHLAEYATLKAMGFSGLFVAGVVLRQAVALALLGFLPGLLLSEGLYRWTTWWAGIPIGMTLGRVVTVLLLTVAMCTISGLGAVRKLQSADPADLF